ncbi:DUF3397 domain-containing protein [Sutcliffiella rhizosphaerae]|uniref:DUF3397 domain-containing protein n=1 Tax=Sutcliffiella rhizosphaerae TaxID=2880967 RepID=A0ABM8YIZ5_9BACI|nr:DUF3397 domain-containing protein [Sutcliffiella rhizosphaerae]CAG9619813.1 hypothetical protein BACCIP111883_00581 [Sutcliffiella rhizosphaerae]
MSNIFASLLATVVSIPVLALLLFYTLARFVTKSNRRSFHFAIDSSTIIFIISVHFLIIIIWQQSMLWIILTVLLGVATLMVIGNYLIKEEINVKRVFKGFWRVNFLLFFFSYFFLSIFGVMKRLYEAFV